MHWKERHQMMSESKAIIHDERRIPVMFTPAHGGVWRLAFCQLHEKINPDGQTVGRGNAQITVDTDTPTAIFVHADVPDLVEGKSFISVLPGVAYKISKAAPQDLFGYRTVRLQRDSKPDGYPVPNWDEID